MPRDRVRSTTAEQARDALEAVASSLPDAAPGNEVARAFSEAAQRPREALVALVSRVAFALAAEARNLGGQCALERDIADHGWPFGADALARALRAARAVLLEDRPLVEFAALEPDELGGFYEGLLAMGVELARQDSIVIRLPRPAGGASIDRLIDAKSERAGRVARGARRERILAGRVALLSTVDRRRSGSHYTPRALTEHVVEAVLGPLLGARPAPEQVLALRVCDPAMGTGAFLVAACRYLGARLLEAEGTRASEAPGDARRRVAEQCLFGVDRDALAVEVARQALWLTIGDQSLPLAALERSLCVGEALLGRPSVAADPTGAPDVLDWQAAFPHVIGERAGFDAFVGNPPWVSYAGRAAQPLSADLRAAYAGYESFRGYRNLQGLFVERCARLLRPGGRLGLVLPSSMSELAGYRPTRRAHDRYCAVDQNLSDLGADAFEGVFQPCMVLSSTRRVAPLAEVDEAAWPVERPDLDAVAQTLIDKLTRDPLPPHLFGERGLQSTTKDAPHLAERSGARHSVPLRSGSDIEPFRLRPPSAHADPAWFGTRLRGAGEWSRVRLLVRQTARVPMVALSDGVGFRNSLLAGFEDDEHPALFLLAYLNSTPIRWLHYVRHRDARQGMPQLKVAHLRSTPSPPSRALVQKLAGVGRELSERGRSIREGEQAELDEMVASAFGLDVEERRRLADFRGSVTDASPRA